MIEVCSICGSPLVGSFGGNRSDTYATYSCEHGPTADYDYDKGTGRAGAPTASRATFVTQQQRIRQLEAELAAARRGR